MAHIGHPIGLILFNYLVIFVGNTRIALDRRASFSIG
jgi:hypothetical protein